MSETSAKKRVLIACGGTGGHLFPGISVGEVLKKRGHEVLLLISEKGIDAVVSEGHQDLEYRTMDTMGMGKLLSLRTLKFMISTWKACRKSRGIVKDFGADTVLGMGGFTSLPPIYAGKGAGCRTLIHDSNAIPGKANRLTARFCDVVLTGFEECRAFFPGKDSRCVGTPIRPAFQEPVDRGKALEAFGFEEGRKTIVVMGGSQGARGVNRAVCRSLELLDLDSTQILHVAGSLDFDEVNAAYEKSEVRSHVVPFLHEMHYAYSLADLAVARSGASTLAELAFFGLPSILIPYPYAAEDHQTKNAEIFTRVNAAVMARESNLEGAELGEMARDLLRDDEELKGMADKAGELAVRDAAERIADEIEKGGEGESDGG
ncbi:MAG: undecaprenyldiphospho-muramoylpentapeptide beta-N-acetylglucosaminyltransferase [Verrucomicrobiota bacterium]